MSTQPILGYWDMQALGEPIRYLLKYAGVDFIDKRYPFGHGQLYRLGAEWLADKSGLELDFPNLPYYMDSDIKLTQSLAIMRYLGRKHGLVARDEKGLARQDMTEQQMEDIRYSLFGILRKPDFESAKQEFISETLIPQLELLTKFLANNEWMAGILTYVDFLAYVSLDWFRLFSPETVDKFPLLTEYMNRFESLPPIKAYQSSAECKRWPLFSPLAKFGYFK